MTTRQHEFCRHYALGLPAPAAAMAAGYARSTAEKNAAALLRHPAVALVLTRMRAYRDDQARTLMDVCLDQLVHTVKYVSDERLKAAASREIRAWLKAGRDLLPSADAFCGDFMGPPTNSNQNAPQGSDNQETDPENKIPAKSRLGPSDIQGYPTLEEHGTLDDGTPAFDIRQSPRKPVPPKPEPIEIRVVDYMDGLDKPPYDPHGRLTNHHAPVPRHDPL